MTKEQIKQWLINDGQVPEGCENNEYWNHWYDVINRMFQGQSLPIDSVIGSFSDKDLLNGYCAGALETLTNKEATFLGYDHLNKIKKEAEEWKERYTNDR